jgi:hypothetical protein
MTTFEHGRIVFIVHSDAEGNVAQRDLGIIHAELRHYLDGKYRSDYSDVEKDKRKRTYIRLIATTY